MEEKLEQLYRVKLERLTSPIDSVFGNELASKLYNAKTEPFGEIIIKRGYLGFEYYELITGIKIPVIMNNPLNLKLEIPFSSYRARIDENSKVDLDYVNYYFDTHDTKEFKESLQKFISEANNKIEPNTLKRR